MKKFILIILFLIPLSNLVSDELTPFDVNLVQNGFKQLKTRKGVSVYLHKSKKIIKVAAEGIIKGPPHVVMKELINYKGQEKLVGRLSESRIIKKGTNWMIVYHHLNLPVISDRDYILQVKFGNDNEIYWVKYEAIKNIGPVKQKGIVRVTDHKASWYLKPITMGKYTFVRFQLRIDMGGLLPKWLARKGAVNELPEVFEGMRKLVEKRLISKK